MEAFEGQHNVMKPAVAVDEMFPEGPPGPFMDVDEPGSGNSSSMLMDLAVNEKDVHTDFFNTFDDLYDEDEENMSK